MEYSKAKQLTDKKLIQKPSGVRRKKKGGRPICMNGHIQKMTQANGRDYYYYRRGIDPPFYLGTAEKILEALKLLKAVKKR